MQLQSKDDESLTPQSVFEFGATVQVRPAECRMSFMCLKCTVASLNGNTRIAIPHNWIERKELHSPGKDVAW